MEDYKKLKADYDRMSAAAQQKIIAEHVDPRDAEIAALKAEVARIRVEADEAIVANLVTRKENERLTRALAAGPAALRTTYVAIIGENAAKAVEAAQEAAMKGEDDHG